MSLKSVLIFLSVLILMGDWCGMVRLGNSRNLNLEITGAIESDHMLLKELNKGIFFPDFLSGSFFLLTTCLLMGDPAYFFSKRPARLFVSRRSFCVLRTIIKQSCPCCKSFDIIFRLTFSRRNYSYERPMDYRSEKSGAT
jgi:hypothetical protein